MDLLTGMSFQTLHDSHRGNTRLQTVVRGRFAPTSSAKFIIPLVHNTPRKQSPRDGWWFSWLVKRAKAQRRRNHLWVGLLIEISNAISIKFQNATSGSHCYSSPLAHLHFDFCKDMGSVPYMLRNSKYYDSSRQLINPAFGKSVSDHGYLLQAHSLQLVRFHFSLGLFLTSS